MNTKQLRKAAREEWDDHLSLVAQVAAQQRRGTAAEEQVKHAIEIVAQAIVQLGRGDLEAAIKTAKKGESNADS